MEKELIVPHEGNEIIFQKTPIKGTYGAVANKLDRLGLKRPTSREIASLFYSELKITNVGKSSIIPILNDWGLLEYTGNLYLPKSNEEINNGVIIEHNPTIQNQKIIMNKNSLIKRLKENDPNVKFVPFGYKVEYLSPVEFSKNAYAIARYGKEGAEKITEVASKYDKKPFLWVFDSVTRERISGSCLNGVVYKGSCLNISGIEWGGNTCSAFGIQKD